MTWAALRRPETGPARSSRAQRGPRPSWLTRLERSAQPRPWAQEVRWARRGPRPALTRGWSRRSTAWQRMFHVKRGLRPAIPRGSSAHRSVAGTRGQEQPCGRWRRRSLRSRDHLRRGVGRSQSNLTGHQHAKAPQRAVEDQSASGRLWMTWPRSDGLGVHVDRDLTAHEPPPSPIGLPRELPPFEPVGSADGTWLTLHVSF